MRLSKIRLAADMPPSSAQRVKRKGFLYAVWENPHVAPDSDGKWQGTYGLQDGGWGRIVPTDRYGYATKQEVIKHLDKLVPELWSNRNSPNRPARIGT